MYHQPCIDLSYHQALPPAPPLSIDLTPDTVYAVYCEKEDWWAGPHWCRGWLLDKEYTFFVLDFGFIITVPPSQSSLSLLLGKCHSQKLCSSTGLYTT